MDKDDGITAYHGSPYDFKKFDTSKIGTGEGAQSYGHGLYFAEHEPVASKYRDRLAYRVSNPQIKIGDQTYPVKMSGRDNDREELLYRLFREAHTDVADNGKVAGPEYTDPTIEMLLGTMRASDDVRKWAKSELMGGKPINIVNPGHMYEVHINAHPHHFLDWDKDLSEQHPHVFDAIKNLIPHDEEHVGGLQEFIGNPDDYTGGAIVDYLNTTYRPKQASQMLHSAGIKGIKYLDAGSRGSNHPPTRNYVVFDHNDVNIKRKYYQGGHVGYGGGGEVPQSVTSEKTSIPQIPALHKSKVITTVPGHRNIDIGGGKFDFGTNYLAKERGIENHVFDPFNRSQEHNDAVVDRFREDPAHSATLANVLNVIPERHHRIKAIKMAHEMTKPDAKSYFSVYEGNRSGKSSPSSKGWQNNLPTESYINEIREVFPHVERRGKVIIGHKFKPSMKDGGVPGYIPHGDKQREKNLKNFHGKTPKEIKNTRWYHGTNQDFSTFKPSSRGAIFVTQHPSFAQDYTKQHMEHWHESAPNNPLYGQPNKPAVHAPNMMPVHVRAEKPFDYENKKHIANLYETLGPDLIMDPYLHRFMDEVRAGDWGAIESSPIQNAIKAMGHDSFYVKEHGMKNLGVYNSNQLKSATGNQGSYALDNPDVTKADGGFIRPQRHTGGRIPEMDKLFKQAKKYVDSHTKSILSTPDDVVVKALRVAQKRI